MVSSPFLYNNQVKLKSPRPPQYHKGHEKSKVIFNLIKRKQGWIHEGEENPTAQKKPATDLTVFPLFLKDQEVKSRRKRWVPSSPWFGKKRPRSSQRPQEDSFLSSIRRKPDSPRPVSFIPAVQKGSPEIGIDQPIKIVQAEDLLTRITSVPQNQKQMFGNTPQRLQQRPQTFRNQINNLSQMEMGQHPSQGNFQQPSNRPPVSNLEGQNQNNGVDPSNYPSYWLNPLYLAAILQQNSRPPYLVVNPPAPPAGPASVSTSCGPNGCSAAAAAGGSSSTSSAAGANVGGQFQPNRPPVDPPGPPPTEVAFTRPPRPVSPGQDSDLLRPPPPEPEVANSEAASSDSSSSGQQNTNDNTSRKRMLNIDNRRKRAPNEATSLQSLLHAHRIDTNVLKTRSQFRPAIPKPVSQILTPPRNVFQDRRQDQGSFYQKTGIRTQSQRPLPDKFYTNSDIFPQFDEDGGYINSGTQTQVVIEKQDLGGFEPESKQTSFKDTAIIALKLSQSIVNLYKTLSPYISGE